MNTFFLLLQACKSDIYIQDRDELIRRCPINFDEVELMDRTPITPVQYTVAATTAGGPTAAPDLLLIANVVFSDVSAERYTLDEAAHPEVYDRVASNPLFEGMNPVRDYPSCDHTRWTAHVSLDVNVRNRNFALAGVLELPIGDFTPDTPGSPGICLGVRGETLVPCGFRVEDLIWDEYI